MITRREFLKYAGAATLSASLIPKLDKLKQFVGEDAPDFEIADTVSSAVAAQKPIRIAYSYTMTDGWMTYPPRDEQSRRNMQLLEYFSALGYTHFLYNLRWDKTLFSKSATGHWVYNRGNYRGEAIAESLRAMKLAVESVKMQLIPARASLSWVEEYIDLDPSISEFRTPQSFRDWVDRNGLPSSMKIKFSQGRVAFVGPNPAMDDIFNEYMKIIKNNWNYPETTLQGGKVPKYIHIGHDELGDYWSCCIKADRSKNLAGTKSNLVAAEIARRVRKIRTMFGAGTSVMIFGDSFLPTDNGEIYGLAGDLVTGSGGVLRLLRDTYKVGNSLIVMPWIYSFRDEIEGKTRDRTGRILPFSKVKQLAYLDRLGLRFIPCPGEDGAASLSDLIERTAETTFEWVRATQMFPGQLAGFAHLGFSALPDPDYPRCNPDTGYCIHYGASLLAYLAWTYGEQSLAIARNNSYGPRIFSRVRPDLSSREQRWEEGLHYSVPRFNSRLLSLAGQ